jgi:SAM-dependent methyltransferase
MTAAGHWNEIFGEGDTQCSWYEERPQRSLDAIRRVATAGAAIIDVGGGSSHLAADLLHAGFTDLTVLDLSTTGLDLARERLGDNADRVHWIVQDLLAWTPERRYAVWHDRALLHFFTDPRDRAAYASKTREALTPDGHVIIATFAPDGPDHCSGQPVHRYATDEILELLGDDFALVDTAHDIHHTPSGTPQPFTYVIAHRLP